MMFDGQSAVEVHPKTNIDDLKTFTSLSLYMKPPVKQPEEAGIADQFILYLGSKNVRARDFKDGDEMKKENYFFSSP